MTIWTLRIQKLKIGSPADFEKKSPSSPFLMRKPLSSDQKRLLRPHLPPIGGTLALKSGPRPPLRALEVSIQKVRKSHFLSWKRVFSSLSEWALPMPETKIWDHFSIQIYPLLVGNMASETTFGHWKVVFSWGKGRKMTFSQNLLIARFWASGFWMSILSSANFRGDPPWKIFFLSVHAPATSELKSPNSIKLMVLVNSGLLLAIMSHICKVAFHCHPEVRTILWWLSFLEPPCISSEFSWFFPWWTFWAIAYCRWMWKIPNCNSGRAV